jgi:hypothetical protein
MKLEEIIVKSMKKLLLPFLMGALALALVIPAAAQDATATTDTSGSAAGAVAAPAVAVPAQQGTGALTCDSSTILLAGLAERYFGYAPTDVTLTNYAYGQYSPLFDMSTMMSSGATTGTGAEATPDMSGAAANPTLAPSTVLLNAPVIAGEDPACTQLRSSLEAFFSAQLQNGTGAWDAKMSGTGASG